MENEETKKSNYQNMKFAAMQSAVAILTSHAKYNLDISDSVIALIKSFVAVYYSYRMHFTDGMDEVIVEKIKEEIEALKDLPLPSVENIDKAVDEIALNMAMQMMRPNPDTES